MAPMSSSSSHNSNTGTGRRRSSATNSRRRPLVRHNSSLLGTIKNLVTAPLAWFASAEDFDDSPDLKGKRRRGPAQNTDPAARDSEGPPQTKRARVQSPDNQIQFHSEPQYAAPAYSQPPMGYLDPPVSVFNNNHNFYRSNSVNMTAAPTLTQLNTTNRSGLSRTMSIDPPQSFMPLSRDASMNFLPLDRDASMEASSFIPKSSSMPRDLSMPLPPARSLRMRSSLTPQPAHPREISEPPPLSSLAQKPVFVRPPPETRDRVLSQSSTSSTLGSLVESQRSTRSPMRQHSLLFGSGSQVQAAELGPAHQRAPAERALHELDIYRTPLLPTRSRLRTKAPASPNATKTTDPSDMFRPRRSSQLLLMRDDRRASSGKTGYPFLDAEDDKEKESKSKKPKVNDTKPYAGEGGMKKLLARRMKEVQDDGNENLDIFQDSTEQTDEAGLESSPLPPPPMTSATWQKSESSSASSGSSLRVGRTKTSRSHLSRPVRPSKKFSAAFDDLDESMDDAQEEERRKEREELEEAASRLPKFEVPAGFTFAKGSNLTPPIEHDTNAPEPPISALPFSISKPPVPSEVIVPLSAPQAAVTSVAPPPPPSLFTAARSEQATTEENTANAERPAPSVPNFFASSKILSQASPVSSLVPSVAPSFGVSDSAVSTPPTAFDATPKHASSTVLPASPAPASISVFTPTSTPVKDNDNPLWEGESGKYKESGLQPSLFGAKSDGGGQSSLFSGGASQSSLFGAKPDGDQPFSFGTKASGDGLPKPDPAPPSSIFGGSLFVASKKDDAPASSLFDAPKPLLTATAGFTFGASSGDAAPSVVSPFAPSALASDAQSKPVSFTPSAGSGATATNAAPDPEIQKAPTFPFGQAAGAPAANAANPFAAQPANSFGSVSEATKPGFGFGFGQQPEPAKPPASPFSFASTSNVPASDSGKPATSNQFSFGSAAPAAPTSTSTFSFGGGTSNTDTKPPTSGMFSFGTPAVMAPSARPSTPPKNDMQEFTMEESPTRDMQAESKPTGPRPTLGGGGSGFSFSNPAPSSSLFAPTPTAPSPAPFAFGAPANSNPFAAPAPADNKPFGSSDFGRAAATPSPFMFSQNTPTAPVEAPRPSTTGSFSFSSAPSSGSGFSFGSGNTTTNANPFTSQPSGGSAPSSPATFTQSFSFGAPPAAPFSFGTNAPASPAVPALNLPQPTTPSGFGGGGFGAQAPSSPFGSGGSQPSGGSFFTMGAAPPPTPGGTGQRVMKKLPRRKQ
ncbi:hypothetical protein R3P38DRAFT_2954549 [Favolaschia claudopus]|uniref:Uncharacterized protein n=1 Tax=Favolaschia claudopus TaxID=2862362 RepID=A0AAW0BBN3_9AGAR